MSLYPRSAFNTTSPMDNGFTFRSLALTIAHISLIYSLCHLFHHALTILHLLLHSSSMSPLCGGLFCPPCSCCRPPLRSLNVSIAWAHLASHTCKSKVDCSGCLQLRLQLFEASSTAVALVEMILRIDVFRLCMIEAFVKSYLLRCALGYRFPLHVAYAAVIIHPFMPNRFKYSADLLLGFCEGLGIVRVDYDRQLPRESSHGLHIVSAFRHVVCHLHVYSSHHSAGKDYYVLFHNLAVALRIECAREVNSRDLKRPRFIDPVYSGREGIVLSGRSYAIMPLADYA